MVGALGYISDRFHRTRKTLGYRDSWHSRTVLTHLEYDPDTTNGTGILTEQARGGAKGACLGRHMTDHPKSAVLWQSQTGRVDM